MGDSSQEPGVVLICGSPTEAVARTRAELADTGGFRLEAPRAGETDLAFLVRCGAVARAAVIAVEAVTGELRRVVHVAGLLGVRHVLFALAAEPAAQEGLERELLAMCEPLAIPDVACAPSAAAAPEMGFVPRLRMAPAALPPEDLGPPEISDQLQAAIVWLHEEPLLRGRSYLMRIGQTELTATVAPLKYRVNAKSLEHVAATTLECGEVGVGDLELSRPVSFRPYEIDHVAGRFTLCDRLTGETAGVGLIRFGLRRAENLSWQRLTVNRAARAARKNQSPCVLWFTGLSGAGKSTIANRVESELHGRGHHTYMLDGDNVRHGLNRDLGFTDADRVENIRRVAEVAKLMIDAGLIVIVSFISPFRSERDMARSLVGENEFFEIFVDTPLGVAEQRDPKGLYLKARRGELANFTGIDSPYEPPEQPDLRIDTTRTPAAEAAEAVIRLLERRSVLADPAAAGSA